MVEKSQQKLLHFRATKGCKKGLKSFLKNSARNRKQKIVFCKFFLCIIHPGFSITSIILFVIVGMAHQLNKWNALYSFQINAFSNKLIIQYSRGCFIIKCIWVYCLMKIPFLGESIEIGEILQISQTKMTTWNEIFILCQYFWKAVLFLSGERSKLRNFVKYLSWGQVEADDHLQDIHELHNLFRQSKIFN